MIICSQCGSTVEENEQFCSECGNSVPTNTASKLPPTILQEVPQPTPAIRDSPVNTLPAIDLGGVSAPQTASTHGTPSSINPKVIAGIGAGLVLIVIIIAISVGGNSAERKLDDAITKKNFFGPSSDNAYDLYNQVKSGGASEQTLRGYAEKLTPLLSEAGLKLTAELPAIGYTEPAANVWEDAAKKLNWAVELNPGNNQIASRAAYCDGRASFLRNDTNRAITLWTQAADLDKTWALPVNGIGLIYLERKSFSDARAYFSEAISRDPNWAIPYANMGNTYTYNKESDLSLAKDFYRQALAKAPNWARPHVHLGSIAMTERDFATAVSEFETALDPNLVGLRSDDAAKIQKSLDTARFRLFGN